MAPGNRLPLGHRGYTRPAFVAVPTDGRGLQSKNLEDSRCVLQHHWVYDQEIYAIKRQKIQMSLLFCFYEVRFQLFLRSV